MVGDGILMANGDKGAFHLQRDDAGSLRVLQRAIKPTLSWRREGREKVTRVKGGAPAGSKRPAPNKGQWICPTSQAEQMPAVPVSMFSTLDKPPPMFWAGQTFNDDEARHAMHSDDIILPPGEVLGNVESKHAVQLPVRAKIEGTK